MSACRGSLKNYSGVYAVFSFFCGNIVHDDGNGTIPFRFWSVLRKFYRRRFVEGIFPRLPECWLGVLSASKSAGIQRGGDGRGVKGALATSDYPGEPMVWPRMGAQRRRPKLSTNRHDEARSISPGNVLAGVCSPPAALWKRLFRRLCWHVCSRIVPLWAAPLLGRRRSLLFLSKVADGREFPDRFPPLDSGLIFTETPLSDSLAKRPAPTDAVFELYHGEDVDISESIAVDHGGGTDFSGERVAVIALWDRKGQLQPYVAHYARRLYEIGYRIILSYGEPLSLESPPREVAATVKRLCPGYDSTSWKAAFTAFPSLFSAHEVLLTNDSVFAPVGDLGRVHEAMNATACDFWGLCESWEIFPHLQGYYVVFRERALRSEAFKGIWKKVLASALREESLRLELTQTMWLAVHGLAPAAYMRCGRLPVRTCSPIHFFWRQMIRYGVPVFKRNLLDEWSGCHFTGDWEAVLSRHGYPTELISNYLSERSE